MYPSLLRNGYPDHVAAGLIASSGAIAGIILAAALAAMMSSADSQLLVATSAIVEDVYHGFLDRDA